MIPPYEAALVEAEKARPPWKSTCTMSGSLWPLIQDGRLTRRWCWNTKRGWERASPRPAPMQRWRRSTAFSAFGALVTAASSHSKYKKDLLSGRKGIDPRGIRPLSKSGERKKAASVWPCCWKVSAPPESGERAALHYGGSCCTRGGHRQMQRENKDNLYPRRPVQEAAAIHSKEGHSNRPGIRHPTGKALNRSNVWREMKALCARANVPPSKGVSAFAASPVRPVLYAIDKDISKLADILGHSNINTTRIYIISTGAEHRQKMERMQLIL